MKETVKRISIISFNQLLISTVKRRIGYWNLTFLQMICIHCQFSLFCIMNRNDPYPLMLILRWVITTVLFSDKKSSYITIILSLSSQTQYFLQCIIETVMNAFPQDENNTSAISELHSILEESSILSANHSILPDDDLRDYFEGIVSLTP